MRKTVSYLLTVLCLVTFAALTSCNPSNSPMDRSEIKNALKRKYGRSFSCVSEDLEKDGSGFIVFEDDDGVRFDVHIQKHSGDWGGRYYTQSENYQLKFYNAHPELFESFSENGHNFDVSTHTMYFSSFDDIDETALFTINKINELERLVKSDSVPNIYSTVAFISFLPEDFKYSSNFHISLSIPGMSQSTKTPEYLANEIKKEYVHLLRDNNDTEELSKLTNEQLSYDPIREIKNITYNGKNIIGGMRYEDCDDNYRPGKSRGYACVTGITPMDKEFIDEKKYDFFKAAGWEVTASQDDAFFRKNGNELKFHMRPITAADREHFKYLTNTYVDVTYNGEPYELDGEAISWSGDTIGITFTEKDFRDLFGIEFYFDQIKGTGEITKLGD